jgi:hypothetical protein
VGQPRLYNLTQPVQYDHSRGCYYSFAETGLGERVITSRNYRGIFKFDALFTVHIPDVKGQ